MEKIVSDNSSFVELCQKQLFSGNYDYIHGVNTFQHFFNDNACNSADDEEEEEEEDSGSDSSLDEEDGEAPPRSESSSEDDDEDEEERERHEKLRSYHSMKAPDPNASRSHTHSFLPEPSEESSDSSQQQQQKPVIMVKKGPSSLPISVSESRSLKSDIRQYQTASNILQEKMDALEKRKLLQSERLEKHYIDCFQYDRDVFSAPTIPIPSCVITNIEKPGLSHSLFNQLTSSLNKESLNTLLFSPEVEREWGESSDFYCITLNKSELIVTLRK